MSNLCWPRMRIEKVQTGPGRTVVETTGAIYTVIHTNPGKIQAVQKINGPRQVFEMVFQASFEKMSLNYQDEEECDLYNPHMDFGFNIRVFADSLLWIRTPMDVRVKTSGTWMPEYSYAEAGNMLFLDKIGGCSQHILPSAHPYGSETTKPEPGISFNAKGWEIRYILPCARMVLACVAPPRPFNQAQACHDRIVHHNTAFKKSDGAWCPYPSDDSIRKFAKVGNILTLHLWCKGAGPMKGMEVKSREDMYGQSAYWASRQYEPFDEKELRRVIKTAHDCGMRVLPYNSPLFFPGTNSEYLKELQRELDTYEFDGIYFDGISEDILENYETMKGTRKILGPDRLLYVHIPSVIQGSSYGEGKYVYCPFIDTYADFLLRAEHIDTFDDAVLRYTISGYNISNAIGFACNYDYNLEFNRELIKRVLDYHVRVPYWAGWDIYLTDRGRALGVKYPPEAEVHKIMAKNYFPALDRLAKKGKRK